MKTLSRGKTGEEKMNALSVRITRSILAMALMCLWVQAVSAQTATTKIVKAANAVLSTYLSPAKGK